MKHLAIASFVSALALAGCGGGDDDQPEATSGPPVGTFVSTSDVQEDGSAFSTPVTVEIDASAVGYAVPCSSLASWDHDH